MTSSQTNCAAASLIAARIRMYVPQRQMLPAIAWSMSASLGWRLVLSSAHDLAALAVAALRHVVLDPGGLHGLADTVFADGFDRGDLLAFGRRKRRHARAHRRAVQVDSAGAAQRLAAAELGAGHAERVTQGPEKRCAGIGIDVHVLGVDGKLGHRRTRMEVGGAS
jgi:hypothetical protein